MLSPKVIAEIGCNHQGKFELAEKLILKAKECGVKYVKFQKRNNKRLLGDRYNDPHPNPINSFGQSYGLHRDFLEFDIDQHKKLKKICDENDMTYSTSVWDFESALEIIKNINPNLIKIPSACNLDKKLLDTIFNHFDGQIHISTGMTTKKEIDKIVEYLNQNYKSKLKKLILYACTSSYPCKFEELNLLEISNLQNKYKNIIGGFGFSGHHLGIAIDIAAFTLGAEFIERHFTLDRTMKGTDHAASLEPEGLKKLQRDLAATQLALSNKEMLSEEEILQKEKLKLIKDL